MTAFPAQNALTIVDQLESVRRLVEIVHKLDQPTPKSE